MYPALLSLAQILPIYPWHFSLKAMVAANPILKYPGHEMIYQSVDDIRYCGQLHDEVERTARASLGEDL